MPWLDIVAATAVIATLIVGFATRRRTPLALVSVGAAATASLCIGFAFEGARWQLIAIAALAVLAVGAVLWARTGRALGLARAVGVLLTVSMIGVGGAAWALPPVHVPAPSGAHPIGVTTTVLIDETRDAHGGDGGGDRRSIPATIWYPAASPGDPADFLPERAKVDELTNALAAQYGMPAILFDGLARARANASWEAAPLDGRHPVVIASPGTGSTRWLATSWAEELASHGVIVIAIDHPYDSAAAELADGTTALSELVTTGDDVRDQQIADEGMAIRATDIRAVIDELDDPDLATEALTSADPTRIVAAGHSLGGAAAVEAARLDDRIDGVVDIDGMPRSPAGTALGRPSVFLVAGDSDPNAPYDRAVEALLADGSAARVTLDGVAHAGFVDAALVIAPVPGITGSRGAEGPRLAARATLIVLAAVSDGEMIDRDALAELGAVG